MMAPQHTDRPIECESLDGLRRRALEAAVAAGVSKARLRALIAAGRPAAERAAAKYALFAVLAHLGSPDGAN